MNGKLWETSTLQFANTPHQPQTEKSTGRTYMGCTTSKGRGGGLSRWSQFGVFLFDVLELFLSFQMTPRLSKLIKEFIFYNWKWSIFFFFLKLFSDCFYPYLRTPQQQGPPFSCAALHIMVCMVPSYRCSLTYPPKSGGELSWIHTRMQSIFHHFLTCTFLFLRSWTSIW